MEFHERLRAVQQLLPNCKYHVNFGLARVPDFIREYNVDLNPDYQRDRVWTLKQKQLFIGTALQMSFNVPTFWFNNPDLFKSNNVTEVVDGKQRLTATLDWLNGDFEAICPSGERFHFSEVDEVGLRGLKATGVTYSFKFVSLPRKEVLKFYLMLNSGGTIHSEEDLKKVRSLLAECEKNENL